MGNTSPLGAYAPLVAAVTSVGVIAAYVVALLVNSPNASQLQPLALLAIGAVLGGATAVNGWKSTTSSLDSRVSTVEANAVNTATVAAQTAATVAATTAVTIAAHPNNGN